MTVVFDLFKQINEIKRNEFKCFQATDSSQDARKPVPPTLLYQAFSLRDDNSFSFPLKQRLPVSNSSLKTRFHNRVFPLLHSFQNRTNPKPVETWPRSCFHKSEAFSLCFFARFFLRAFFPIFLLLLEVPGYLTIYPSK